MMEENRLCCPGCGSKEVIEVGTSKAMCQECYEVFNTKPSPVEEPTQESPPPKTNACPICGDANPETEVDECPMCGRKNICKKHLDEAGLCPDCSRALDEASQKASTQIATDVPQETESVPHRDTRPLAGKMAPFLVLLFLAALVLLFGIVKCVIDFAEY